MLLNLCFSCTTPRDFVDGYSRSLAKELMVGFLLAVMLLLAPNFASAQQLFLRADTTDPVEGTVTVNMITDPANHSCCVLAPPSALETFLQGGDLVIREVGGANNVPWLNFDPMMIDSNLEFRGESRATVAGFSNVLTVLTGTLQQNKVVAEARVGADGGLPDGEAIVFDLEIDLPIATHLFGHDLGFPNLGLQAAVGLGIQIVERPLSTPFSTVEMLLSINAGEEENTEADWWLVMQDHADNDQLYYYDVVLGAWIPGLLPSHQGPLVTIADPVQLFTDYTGPSDDFTIVFGVDRAPNGQFDIDNATVGGFHFYF